MAIPAFNQAYDFHDAPFAQALSHATTTNNAELFRTGFGRIGAVLDRERETLTLSHAFGGEIPRLAQLVEAWLPSIRIVLGPERVASGLAKMLGRRMSRSIKEERRQRLFAIHHAPAQIADIPGGARIATGDDAGFVTQAIGSLGLHNRPAENEYLSRDFISTHRAMVWDIDRPVALAVFGISDGTTYEIASVFTANEHRRQGYCRALLVQMIAGHWGMKPGALPTLFVQDGNLAAQYLYERMGFDALDWWWMAEFAP